MRLAILLLAAAATLRFDVTDARGKKPSGLVVQAGDPDADGWRKLTIARAKNQSVIVWPFDSLASDAEGPGTISVVAIERGDPKALSNPRVAAAIATGVLLGFESLDDAARRTGFDRNALQTAFDALANADDDYARGVGLLWKKDSALAAKALGSALWVRERQLTRVPSDIFPAAMLSGRALFGLGKYDDAAVAYLQAMNLRPSDARVRKARADALIKAGKEDAGRELLHRQ